MRVGGRSGWGLALAPAAVALLSVGPAWGQEREATQPSPAADVAPPAKAAPETSTAAPAAAIPPATAAPADSLSPMRLMDGPSLRETGRIAIAPAPAPMNLIENEESLKSPKETRAASSIEIAPARPPSGVIDQRVLDREIAERFTQIADCRVEVARAKQVTPPQITADTLLLRWTIERDGSTASTDVVATAPVDLGIMVCAKRVMSQWKFTPPRGGSKAVERPFAFTGNVPAAAR
jgi:hypothetical protein